MLFAAASTGGAYNLGSFGAHDRLAAWQPLTRLFGAVEGVPVSDVEARVRECTWHAERGAAYFWRIAWSMAILLASRPPSTGSVTPVIHAASAEARNATAAAMSPGSPTRPNG